MNILRYTISIAAICAAVGSALLVRAADARYELNALVPVTGEGAFLGKSYEEALTALEKDRAKSTWLQVSAPKGALR